MATLKQRLHRKNASGTYDTVHFESTSDLILRPSGRTVEQDLADYLPEVQNNDNVPESLAKLIVGTNYGFIRGKRLATLDELNGKANTNHTHSQYLTEIAVNSLIVSKLSNYYTKSEVDALIDVAYPTYRWNKYYPYKITNISNQRIVAPDNDNQDGCYYFDSFPEIKIGAVSSNYSTTYDYAGYLMFRSSENNLSEAQSLMIGKYAWDPDDRHTLRRVILVDRVNSGGSGYYLYGTAYDLSQTATQGDFVEEITSPDPSAYPNNGYDPNTGYWYVKQS